MRIQHNIPALNAYRNYNINQSAVAKNLEKLSSGYKINRAGDDAAGLAISEKMRAQIAGLGAAQKNVKDGINLVKTAEGAMQEVQDMLNRMVTLATQSANGTYDNEVDRANLQKEVDQLNEEINRIADSANFNGIKLMDGSLEGDTISYTTKTSASTDLTITGQANAGSTIHDGTTVGGIGVSTFVHAAAQSPSLTEFKLDLEGIRYGATDTGSAAANVVTIGLWNQDGSTNAVSFGVTIGTKGDSMNGKDVAEAIYNSLSASDYQAVVNGVSYNVTLDGSKLVFKMDEAAFNTVTLAISLTGNFSVTVAHGNNIDVKKGSSIINGTEEINEGKLAADVQLASTVTNKSDLTLSWFRDGKAIKLGDETYVFALTDKTKNAKYDAGYKVVDLTDLVDHDKVPPQLNERAVAGDEIQTLSEVAARLTQAAKDNEMWAVGATAKADGDAITNKTSPTSGSAIMSIAVREKSSYRGGADLTTYKQIQKQIQFFDKVTVDENVTMGKGTPLTLQIGDTSDKFNQLRVSIGDIHTSALGIDKINIGTQSGAQSAIDTIRSAINQVSSIRGTLGATQNRLEHTQNNLGVMEENITDAESTIRDTDIAAEMMAYTKNNILVQSAQAMLAQANQIPQGVLQLLG